MNEKTYYELDSEIKNLKKMQEQLEVLHNQQVNKIKQAEVDKSQSNVELKGKIHEFGFLYNQAVNSIREDFPKKLAGIEEKITEEFNQAYLKEMDIDQKIIELESKMSSYTIHDQTQAILGLTREIRKNNLAKEISEGDYTDLLSLYRIALRTNNRTDLAFIENRIEKLTRKDGKNSKDNESKKTLLELIRNSVAKRVDPKVLELKNRLDKILEAHDQVIKAMEDVEKLEEHDQNIESMDENLDKLEDKLEEQTLNMEAMEDVEKLEEHDQNIESMDENLDKLEDKLEEQTLNMEAMEDVEKLEEHDQSIESIDENLDKLEDKLEEQTLNMEAMEDVGTNEG